MALLLGGCAGSPTPGGTLPGGPTGEAGGGAVEHPSGAQTLRKGESHRVEINGGQSHEWDTVRVSVGADCPQLRYTLGAR